MKKEFIDYLKSVGMTKPLQEKVETAFEFYQKICPEKILDVFVSDYIKDDGSREYESLWFFSEKYCMEADQFVTKDNFDLCTIRKRVHRWLIKKQNYDFKKATEKSRLNVVFHLTELIRGELKASKSNCDYLRDIILKYIVPNLEE